MGSFEEEGELPSRAPARGAVRSLHVHVPTARAWRLQVGQGADPGVRHLRRVQAPVAILTRATSRPWPLSRNSIPGLPPTSPSSSTTPRVWPASGEGASGHFERAAPVRLDVLRRLSYGRAPSTRTRTVEKP